MLSDCNRPFESLGIVGNIPQSLSVAVPSRICSSPSGATPLLGMRIGVKDLFDIAGLRMTLSNRAFYAASTPAQTTAPAIQKLLDAGAVMVGTTKCSSMKTLQKQSTSKHPTTQEVMAISLRLEVAVEELLL